MELKTITRVSYTYTYMDEPGGNFADIIYIDGDHSKKSKALIRDVVREYCMRKDLSIQRDSIKIDSVLKMNERLVIL